MAEMSDRQVEDLLYDLRQLVDTLNNQRMGTKGLEETKQAISDNSRGIDRLILALGKLASTVDGSTKTKTEEQRYMRRFAADTDRAADAQEKQRRQINQNITAARREADLRAEAARNALKTEDQIAQERLTTERLAKEAARRNKDQGVRDLSRTLRERQRETSVSRELFDQLGNTGTTAERLKNGFQDLAGNNLALQATFQLLTSTITGTTQALKSFSSALYQGQRGAQVSAEAIEDLADPVLDTIGSIGNLVSLLSIFVPGGIFVKGAIFVGGQLIKLGSEAGELAIELNKLAAQQVDALFKSFRQLSTVGASGAQGLDGAFDLMQRLGMSVSEVDQFNSMITESSRKLAFMGTTVADGARAFADVAGGLYKSELGEQLEMLGMSAQEQRESAMAYMNIQARTGRLQVRNTRDLIEASSDFARELDLAAQLTGQSRKDQAAAREAALAETRFRAAMVQAQQTGDTERLARLDAAQQAAAVAKAFGDERGFRGILQYAAGGMTTPEAVAAEQTYRISELLARPGMSQIEMAQHMGESVRLQQQQLAGATALVGNIDALQTDFVKTADFQQRISNLLEEANRQGLSGPDALLKVLETEQGKRIAAGGDTELMVEAGRLQQSAAMIQDAALRRFNIAANINATASDLFSEAVDFFADIVGVPEPSGGLLRVGGREVGTPGAAGGPAIPTDVPPRPNSQGGRNRAQDRWDRLYGATHNPDGTLKEGAGAVPMSAPSAAAPPAAAPSAAAPSAAAPSAAVPPVVGTATGQQILDFLAQYESNGNYNIVNGGSTLDLTSMSVAQVLQEQGRWRSWPGATSSAVGRYQIIRSTLRGLVNNGVLDLQDTFDQTTQNKAGMALLRGRGLNSYLSGDMSPASFARSLSMEWAALPAGAHGQSYYAGVGNNQAHVSWDSMMTLLNGARNGGVFSGPASGYGMTMHGTEAVVPLPDGRNIPVDIQGPRSKFNSALGGISTDFGSTDSVGGTARTGGNSSSIQAAIENLRTDLREMIASQRGSTGSLETAKLLSDLVDLQRRSNSTSERILQVQQS